jgi:WhiB family redox-sensing transcriptional regulator
MEGNVVQAAETPSRRARILAHLAGHPDLSVHEICRVLGFIRESGRGCTGGVLYLLRSMEEQALVVAHTEFRARQGRQVRLWRAAPLGTVPSPAAQTLMERRRERDRLSKRRARARGDVAAPGVRAGVIARDKLPVAASWRLPPGSACRDADARLFFPEPGESDAQAKAICAVCPVWAECLAVALANGERYGVWGGVNLEAGEHIVSGAS